MKNIDYSTPKEFTTFIPSHLLEVCVNVINEKNNLPEVGTWKVVNRHQNNWIEDGMWRRNVHTIVKLRKDLILVVFNDKYHNGDRLIENHATALYQGTLE